MNILFMSLLDFDSLKGRNIYTDLLRQFVANGHKVTVISPYEKRTGKKEGRVKEQNCVIIKFKIGNTQKVNFVEKGISMLMLERQMVQGIKRYLRGEKFDLILYTTPPITFQKAISYIKKRDNAKTYLLLKDIFPQNALDLGILSTKGWKGLFYRYFRYKERRLYRISDYIGCMSQGNVEYVLQHNPEVKTRNDKEKKEKGKEIIEVCPNCIEPIDINISEEERVELRRKYGIPLDKTVFIYGGNLGKPQGIKDLLYCICRCEIENSFFLVIGSGTEYKYLEKYVEEKKSDNLLILPGLPKEEYERVAKCCDVGLVCLDRHFTIPNFPSRILSYMQESIPVLAMTDANTDLREVIAEGNFGYWCENGDVEAFNLLCGKLQKKELLDDLGDNARRYLEEHYTAKIGYEIIMKSQGI